MKDSFVEEGFMTQKSREQRVRYKLDESMTLNQEEIKIYNVPFAGNTNTCKETFVKGERILEYCIEEYPSSKSIQQGSCNAISLRILSFR